MGKSDVCFNHWNLKSSSRQFSFVNVLWVNTISSSVKVLVDSTKENFLSFMRFFIEDTGASRQRRTTNKKSKTRTGAPCTEKDHGQSLAIKTSAARPASCVVRRE